MKSLVAETERKMAAVVGARSCMSPASLTFVVSKDSQERQLGPGLGQKLKKAKSDADPKLP